MTADSEPRAEGTSTVRGRPRAFVSPVGGLRLEASLALAVSLLGGVFTIQSLPELASQWRYMDSPLGLTLVVLVYGSIALACLASVLRQWMRTFFTIAAVAYLIALALIEFAFTSPISQTESPWIFALATLAEGYLIVGRRDWIVPMMYALFTCALLGVIRTTPAGGSATDERAVLDSLYVLALDTGLLVLIVAGRQAARTVDHAQNTALERYALAQVDQATESERVQIDALVHDSVLTTFLTAARADDPKSMELAQRMASNAISQLSQAEVLTGDAPPVTLAELAGRIRAEAGATADSFSMQTQGTRSRAIPASAADAIVSASVQAMVNSVNHAGDASVPRWVRLSATSTNGVRAVVADRGSGFEIDQVNPERLGLRVSIRERLRSVGGVATITSAPGRGTRVVVQWPDPGVADPSTPGVPYREPVGVQ